MTHSLLRGTGTSRDPDRSAELGSGSSLDARTLASMERGFGRSFTGVRMHTDATAARLSSAFSARAFTVGHHVAFAGGAYRPGSLPGDLLIAHEQAHTIQQGHSEHVAGRWPVTGASYGGL